MKYLLLLCAFPAFAQLTVTVSGATATEAVLSYAAPTPSSCTLQVSTVAGLSPVVHDVDGTLFTNANVDLSRATTISEGSTRIVVVGARTSASALDGVTFYSRALQANTNHFVKVTCGSSTGTTTFVTANPPL